MRFWKNIVQQEIRSSMDLDITMSMKAMWKTNNIRSFFSQVSCASISFSITKQPICSIRPAKSRRSLSDQVAQFHGWLEKTSVADVSRDDAFLQRTSQQLLLRRTISYPHLAIFVFLNRQQLQDQMKAFLAEQESPGLSIALRLRVPLPSF